MLGVVEQLNDREMMVLRSAYADVFVLVEQQILFHPFHIVGNYHKEWIFNEIANVGYGPVVIVFCASVLLAPRPIDMYAYRFFFFFKHFNEALAAFREFLGLDGKCLAHFFCYTVEVTVGQP